MSLDRTNNFEVPVGRSRKVSDTEEGFFNHKGVSRNHGTVRYRNGKLFFVDNESRNGTSILIDNKPIEIIPNEETLLTDDLADDFSKVCLIHFAPNLSAVSALKVEVEALLKLDDVSLNMEEDEQEKKEIEQLAFSSSPSSFNANSEASVQPRSSSISPYEDDKVDDKSIVDFSVDADETLVQISLTGEEEGEDQEEIITTIVETVVETKDIEEKKELNDDENFEGNASNEDDEEYPVDAPTASSEVDIENDKEPAEIEAYGIRSEEEEEVEEASTQKAEKASKLGSVLSSLFKPSLSRKRKRDAEDDGEDVRQEVEQEEAVTTAEDTKPEEEKEELSEEPSEIDRDSISKPDTEEKPVPTVPNPNKKARVGNYVWAFGSGALVGAAGIFSWLIHTAPE